jgi:hypothetical protein
MRKYFRSKTYVSLGTYRVDLELMSNGCSDEVMLRVVYIYARSWSLTLTRLMSYIYGAPILDVSRSHTTTQHSR